MISANVHRRHTTTGQRAMAVAVIYPEPERLNGKGSGSLETKELSATRLSQARTVLQFAGDLAGDILSGAISLDDAYQKARERKKAKDWRNVRRTVFMDLSEVRRIASFAHRDAHSELPAWLEDEECAAEFRQYVPGGVEELCKSVAELRTATKGIQGAGHEAAQEAEAELARKIAFMRPGRTMPRGGAPRASPARSIFTHF